MAYKSLHATSSGGCVCMPLVIFTISFPNIILVIALARHFDLCPDAQRQFVDLIRTRSMLNRKPITIRCRDPRFETSYTASIEKSETIRVCISKENSWLEVFFYSVSEINWVWDGINEIFLWFQLHRRFSFIDSRCTCVKKFIDLTF